jgi:hypothetical protein
MYSFRLAVEANGMLSDFSKPQHIMTHCIKDEDCAWGGRSSSSGGSSSGSSGGSSSGSSSGGGINNRPPHPHPLNVTCNVHTRLCEGFDPVQLQHGLSKAISKWNNASMSFPLVLVLSLLLLSIFLYYPSGHELNNNASVVIDHDNKRVFTTFGPDLVNLPCRPMQSMNKWPYQTMDITDHFNQQHFVRHVFIFLVFVEIWQTTYDGLY